MIKILLVFQSTSSEEDVVSILCARLLHPLTRFNPRPPKRTLCLIDTQYLFGSIHVSIHVLRRGRCVLFGSSLFVGFTSFQSTSSEEDVVSVKPPTVIS